jgi:AcrR family transcriptional regulator
MSPRPRKVSDEEVLAAAYRAMQRLGPPELTLGAIAAEAGVTAGALVQRFGSKRALLLALAEGAAASGGVMLRELRVEHGSALETVRAYAECMAGLASSPETLARTLAYLQIDLTDPDFRAHLLTQARASRDGIRMLLEEASSAGELARGTETDVLAGTVEVAINGALFTWAVHQEGSAEQFLREAVDAVLAPHLGKRRGGGGTRGRK